MEFKKYTEESEKFVSANFHYDKNDSSETLLKRAIEDVIKAGNALDIMKKNKFYGKPLPNGTQTVIPDNMEFKKDDPSELLIHAYIGSVTEAIEGLQAIYDYKWLNKELDEVNLQEEQGDAYWYDAIKFRSLDWDLGKILQKNIDKLTSRYGDKFSEEKAINRNLDKERDILEKK